MEYGRKRKRDQMPEIAAFVESLAEAFGHDYIEDLVRRGQRGEPTFYASENGIEVGTRSPDPVSIWRCSGKGLRDRHGCEGCDGSCIGTQQRCTRPDRS
ncbi:hypothetical protein [Burkholderia ambifaria]|uniref:hypothetical protein n=1 Tax=Burkholderia ambifaria TaxID=152480 RepID=UPI002FE04B83